MKVREKATHDKTRKDSSKSLRLVVVFLGLVLLASLISLFVRITYLVGSSAYDGEHRFILAIQDSNRRVLVVSFDPSDTISILTLKGNHTAKEAQILLSTPIDARVVFSERIATDDLSGIFWQALFSRNVSHQSLTTLDLLRLYILSLNNKDIVRETLAVEKPLEDASMRKYFSDKGVVRDDKAIAIVNAAGEFGLGRKLELGLTNIGGSVVSVTTARNVEAKTRLYFEIPKSFTVKKIEGILQITGEEGDTGAADILIIVGKDSLNKAIFATL